MASKPQIYIKPNMYLCIYMLNVHYIPTQLPIQHFKLCARSPTHSIDVLYTSPKLKIVAAVMNISFVGFSYVNCEISCLI